MKRIFLTGGTGFVGHNLKEALSAEYEIFAPSHSELELLDETAVCQYIARNKIDYIIHSAIHVPMVNGEHNEFYNDMRMFLNLKKNSGLVDRILYFGSGAEYDKRFDIRGVKEEEIGRTLPVTEYALAKYMMNELARASNNIYNLRLFGIFGKYELFYLKFISNLCCKAILDLPLTVRKECYFDFLYIDDLVAAVKLFLKREPRYHDYNVCSGRENLLTDLARKVCKRSAKDLPVTLLSGERNRDYSASNERIRKEFPEWQVTPIEEAIDDLYEYYERIREQIDADVLEKSI